MATIIADPFVDRVAETPVKSNPVVTSTEVVPDYSPGAVPQYVAQKTTARDPEILRLEQLRPGQQQQPGVEGPELMMMPPPPVKAHPVLPAGDIINDIRTHLRCTQNFNMNIETLLYQFIIMKKDLDDTRKDLAQSQREVKREREEKEGYKEQARLYKTALDEAQEELTQVRADLLASEERLRSSIQQLAEAAKKLQISRNELRVMTAERDEWNRRFTDSEREVQFLKARVAELQTALDCANVGENNANDRNTRLTAMLYQIESAKAAIERKKDQTEARIRELELTISQLENEMRDDSDNRNLNLKLRMKIQDLQSQIQREQSLRQGAQKETTEREGQIIVLRATNELLQTENNKVAASRDFYSNLADIYGKTAAGLPHRVCRNAFPTFRITTAADGTEQLETIEGEDASTTSTEPSPSNEAEVPPPTQPKEEFFESN